MQATITLEQIRENVSLMQAAIEQLDELVRNINDARWKFEMLSRRPELGGAPNDPNRITPGTLLANMLRLSDQRFAAGDILCLFTGAATVEEARERYLDLYAAYQRYTQLVELRTLKEVGAPLKATDEYEMLAGSATISEAIDLAWGTLLNRAERFQPGLPQISEVPSVEGASMTLNSGEE